MKGNGDPGASQQVAEIVRQCLEEGAIVDIDGLGTFRSGKDGVEFQARCFPTVFLAYVEEDAESVKRLARDFRRHGLDAWMDKERLLPGQNWPRAIERAIEVSDFFVACFSRRAASKRGHFQSELRYALDCATRLPFEQVYFIPVRLDECLVPRRIARKIQYVDLFPDWEKGVRRILSVIRRQSRKTGK